MDRKYIDDNHVIARHLAGRLSDAEDAAFEAYCFEHPDMVREMESAARLKGGLAALRDSGELDALLKSEPRPRATAFKLAAAVVVFTMLGLLLFTSMSALRAPAMGPTAVAVSGRFGGPLPTSSAYNVYRRRSVYDAAIDLPIDAHAIELQVLPETTSASDIYRITLFAVVNDSRKQVASLGELKIAADGRIHIFANSSRLAPGIYELVVSPQDVVDATADSSFRIVARATGDQTDTAR